MDVFMEYQNSALLVLLLLTGGGIVVQLLLGCAHANDNSIASDMVQTTQFCLMVLVRTCICNMNSTEELIIAVFS